MKKEKTDFSDIIELINDDIDIKEAFDKVYFDIISREPCYCDISKIIKKDFKIDDVRKELRSYSRYYYHKAVTFLPKLRNIQYEMNMFKKDAEMNMFKKDAEMNIQCAILIIEYIICFIAGREADRETFVEAIIDYYNNVFSNQTNTILIFKNNFIFSSEVNINFIKTLEDFTKFIINTSDSSPVNSINYYRGHSSTKYKLIPAVFREEKYRESENRLYHEILLRNPSEFKDCKTAIEKMVIMQHFGLNTRLLDITSNPMVALYFACCSKQNENGEVIVFTINEKIERLYDDNEVAALAAFSEVNYVYKKDYYTGDKKARDNILSSLKKIARPEYGFPQWDSFKDSIGEFSFFVKIPMNNSRIVAQNGSVILCSDRVNEEKYSLVQYQNKDIEGCYNICIINREAKQQLLKELSIIGVHEASVFPDFAHSAHYISETISGHQEELDCINKQKRK